MKKIILIILALLLIPSVQADYRCQVCTEIVTPTVSPSPTATPAPTVRVIRYTESDAIFGNPEIGFQTTRKTKAQVSNPRGIPLTMATFRTCAHQINPSPGVFNWSEFDTFLTAANAQGQTVQIGLVMYDPYDCSGWLRNNIPSVGVYCSSENPSRTYYAPDWNSAQVQGAHRSLIAAFAAKYNNDARVDSIDVRSIGDYGEWHHSCLKVRSTNQPHPMPNEVSRRAIIKDYHDFFTSKPLVHIIDDSVSRQEAVTRGAGWRADCWGGHHEDDLYPGWLNNPMDMSRVWTHASVALEPCGPLTSTAYMSLSRKIEEAIEKRASSINTKNDIAFTDAQWPEWQRLLRKMGYRLVVRSAIIQDGFTTFNIENVGIAPNYKPITFKYNSGSIAAAKILPNVIMNITFPYTSGTLIAEMEGRPIRFANVENISVN